MNEARILRLQTRLSEYKQWLKKNAATSSPEEITQINEGIATLEKILQEAKNSKPMMREQ